ncbi:calcium-binding protein [Limnohabitans sp. Hippo4]|uniref:beta strand repeat-containing protein n=1 Tax=Limnohabitans sp. Hippo4 TaxID=1826167 RepID=UPI001304C396|nr:calcium-binding protein [Limnohabitans sp. Hippo4]
MTNSAPLSSRDVKLRYEECLQNWGNAKTTYGINGLNGSIDVVLNLGVGDKFDLSALGLHNSINGPAIISSLSAVSTSGTWGLIKGTYVGGIFTANTGLDTHTLLAYDTEGVSGGNLGSVVLKGLFGGSAIKGIVTLTAPGPVSPNLTLTGTSSNETLTGGVGDDTLSGLGGVDNLLGAGGNDIFNVTNTADDGNDIIDGGTGNDTIAVAAGQAIVFATVDANITNVEYVTLGAGASVTLTGQTEGFNITGNTGNETVVGGAGNDTISTGAGNDTVNGGAGADLLTGGAGADALDVGIDAVVDTVLLSVTADSYVGSIVSGTTNLSASVDVVSNLAVGDQIDLRALGLNASINGAAVNTNLAAVSAAGTWGLVVGNYVGGVFTQNTGAETHTLLVYDIDGVAGGSLGAVVLSGLFDGSAVNGLITLAAITGLALIDSGGNDNLTGGAGNDTLTGGVGTDNLVGGAGNDIFYVTNTADDGGDTVNGGLGTNDSIVVATAQTIVFAAVDNNIRGVEFVTLGSGASVTLTGQTEGFNITASSGNETVVGSDGPDIMTGGTGTDNLSGGLGDDVFNVISSDGGDTLQGDGGNDTIVVGAAESVTFSNDARITGIENITLGAGSSVTLTGQTEAFTITGGEGNQTIYGGNAADSITGGPGTDNIYGGSGDDTFYVSNTANDGNDLINGEGGINDTIVVAAGQTIIFSSVDSKIAGIEIFTLGAGSSVTLTGQTEDYLKINGTSGIETIIGSNGADQITGGGGADNLSGGLGNDLFYFASGAYLGQAANVSGDAGTDRMIFNGGPGSVVLVDSDFANVSSMDNIEFSLSGGGGGSHSFTLGTAASAAFPNGISFYGAAMFNSTSLTIDAANLTVPISILTGSAFVIESIQGGSANDILKGYSAADTLNGGGGNDTITGGQSTDTLTGGSGSDTFVYTTASDSNANSSNIDRITDLVLNGSSGDFLDFTLTGTLTVRTATVAAALTAADNVSEITGLFNSTNGTESASELFTGGTNATAILATFNNGILLIVDVDGNGSYTANDVVINVTGVTVTDFSTACFV